MKPFSKLEIRPPNNVISNVLFRDQRNSVIPIHYCAHM